jgi:GNAT superfamily N-acetyltransferase
VLRGRKEFRGQGLAARLLDAAVDHARTHGARVVEGYPVDTSAGKTSSNDLYHGALSSFVDAGFVEVARPGPHDRSSRSRWRDWTRDRHGRIEG